MTDVMEKNKDTLKAAIAKLPDYEPDEGVWDSLAQQMSELPLKNRLAELPQYEPDELLWELIVKKSEIAKQRRMRWYAAAVIVMIAGIGLFQKRSEQPIAFTQEQVDERLQADTNSLTDEKYEKLKAYCETETLVCHSKDYRRLQDEYERLNVAARQLQQAIGTYNTEPELIRQFSTVEQQKAEVLNEMAKMI
jgi:uncharacterized membrane-anchored protein YhcB (DUF1043 family)